MSNYEKGSIIVDADLDSSGFEAGSEKLLRATRSVIDTVSRLGPTIQKAAQGFHELKNKSVSDFKETENTAKDLRTELEEQQQVIDQLEEALSNYYRKANAIEKDTNEQIANYKNLFPNASEEAESGYKETALAHQEMELQRLRDQYAELLSALDNAQHRYGEIAEKISTDTQKVAESAEEAGNALDHMADSTETIKVTPLETLRNALGSSLSWFRGLKTSTVDFSQAMRQMGTSVSGALSKVTRFAGGAAKALLHLGQSSRKADSSMKNNLMTILRYAVGIRSLYALIRRLSRFITEGFENLAQYSDRTNRSISSVMSALTQLKNSLAASFAPILDTIAPALTQFIHLLSSAVTTLGTFFALLTGRSVMLRAKAVQEDYAKSLDKTGKAAKETKRQLAGFDELNILKDTGSSGADGGGGVNPSDMFEEVPVEPPEWIRRIVDALRDMAGVARHAWEDAGQGVMDAWRDVADTILGLLSNIGRDFYRVFMAGYGYDWIVSLLRLLESVLRVVWAIVSAFRTAWNDDNRGYRYLASLFGMFTRINSLLAAIGRAFVTAWNNGIGAEIAGNLLDIYTNINLAIGWIAENLRKAWEDTRLGVSIWTTILMMVNDVLSAVNRMSAATAAWAKGLDFAPLLASFDRLLKAVEPLVALIADGLAGAYEHVLLPLGKWTIETALPVVIDALAASFRLLSAALEAAQPLVVWIWEHWLEPLAKWTGALFVRVMKEITDLLNDLADLVSGKISFTEFIDGLSGLQIALIEVAAALAGLKLLAFLEALIKAGPGASAVFGSLIAKVGALATGLTGLVDAVLVAYDIAQLREAYKGWKSVNEEHYAATERYCENLAKVYERGGQEALNAVTGTNQSLKESQAQAWAEYEAMPHNMWEGFKAGWAYYFGENGAGLFRLLGDAFSGAVDGVRDMLGIHSPSTVFFGIGENSAQGYLQGLRDTWPDVAAFFETAWDNIHSGASSAWDTISSTLSGVWGRIQDNANQNCKSIETSTVKTWATLKQDLPKKTEEIRSQVIAKLQSLARGMKPIWTTAQTDAANSMKSMESSTVQSAQSSSSRILSAFRSLQSALSGVWSGIRGAASGALSGISGLVGSLVSSVSSRVSTLQSSVASTLSRLSTSINDTARKSSTGSVSGTFASGGRITDSGRMTWWDGVRKYAAGTLRAHGTLFAAGEAGPEIVGHVNGRTEVLNQSQIAGAIHAAVVSGMETALSAAMAASGPTPVEVVAFDVSMIDRLTAFANQTRFPVPAVSEGSVLPYEIVAAIDRQTDRLERSIDENTEELIRGIISALGSQTTALSSAFVAALREYLHSQTGGMTFDEIRDAANLRQQMYGQAPIFA